jgi:hypothetical protein
MVNGRPRASDQQRFTDMDISCLPSNVKIALAEIMWTLAFKPLLASSLTPVMTSLQE